MYKLDNVNCVDITFLCVDKSKLLERNYVHSLDGSFDVCKSTYSFTWFSVPEAVVGVYNGSAGEGLVSFLTKVIERMVESV